MALAHANRSFLIYKHISESKQQDVKAAVPRQGKRMSHTPYFMFSNFQVSSSQKELEITGVIFLFDGFVVW